MIQKVRLLWCCLLLACGASYSRAEPADLLLTSAAVYTVNAARPWAEAIAIRDGTIILRGEDVHSSWADSRAHSLVGIEAETPDPVKAVIERDFESEPSGTLRESAQKLVERIVPALMSADYLQAGRLALKLANSYGITSMIDVASTDLEIETFQKTHDSDELTARMVLSLSVVSSIGASMDPDQIRPDGRGTDKRLRMDAAKVLIDGIVQDETAALLEPYIGRGGATGAVLVGGSDWFVSSMNLLKAIETTVTRADEVGLVEAELKINERMPLPAMIDVYTRNGAFIMHREDKFGTIEDGKWTDLVVLEENLFEIPSALIGDVKVHMTLLQGEVVYRR